MNCITSIYHAAELSCVQAGQGYVADFLVQGGVDPKTGQIASYNQFACRPFDQNKQTGWRVHLSVAPDDIAKATQLVCAVYKKFNAAVFAVARPDVARSLAAPSQGQAGKMFTLYDMGEGCWPQIVTEIEYAFRDHEIRTGASVHGDRQIPGSQYISYRNDGTGQGGRYFHPQDLQSLPADVRYNPLQVADPFAKLSFAPPSPYASIGETTNPGRDAMSLSKWNMAKSPSQGAVIRADIEDMAPEHRSAMQEYLLQAGIQSARCHKDGHSRMCMQVNQAESAKLLRVITKLTPRTNARDVFDTLVLKNMDSPQHGKDVVRGDASHLLPQERNMLLEFLKGHNIKTARFVISNTFKKLYLQILPEDKTNLDRVRGKRPAEPCFIVPHFTNAH